MNFLAKLFKRDKTPKTVNPPKNHVQDTGIVFDDPSTFPLAMFMLANVSSAIIINHEQDNDYTINIDNSDHKVTLGDTVHYQDGTVTITPQA